jgi:hypothetical protein
MSSIFFIFYKNLNEIYLQLKTVKERERHPVKQTNNNNNSNSNATSLSVGSYVGGNALPARDTDHLFHWHVSLKSELLRKKKKLRWMEMQTQYPII